MRYDEQALKDIAEKYAEIGRIHEQLALRLSSMESTLCDARAKEHLTQGVGRRLSILTRCIQNIFSIFPVGRTEPLAPEELADLNINLHAFLINLSGLLDNLGWVFVFANNLLGDSKEGKLAKKNIGLFNEKTQPYLPEKLRTYLNTERMKRWYSEYSQNYRDALAHRIPLYVPPFELIGEEGEKYRALEDQIHGLDLSVSANFAIYDQLREKQKELGRASLFFMHSFDEGSHPRLLHAQVIIDYLTVEEILNSFCENIQTKPL
jgi:hypothetical protein